MKPVAILSTTILPLDGVYAVVGTKTLGILNEGCLVDVPTALRTDVSSLYPGPYSAQVDVTFLDVPHYVGHPASKALLEAAGAVPAAERLFPGLLVGEVALCITNVQGKSDRSQGGSAIHQEVTWENLDIRIILRLA